MSYIYVTVYVTTTGVAPADRIRPNWTNWVGYLPNAKFEINIKAYITCKRGSAAVLRTVQLSFLWERANFAPLQSRKYRTNNTNQHQILND